MRASELRGLRWADVDLPGARLTVRQRADHYGSIGAPKSHAGEREIPLGRDTMVLNTLKAWKLANPGDLVFPAPDGRVAHYSMIARPLAALMVKAGLVDGEGNPKFSWHSLRHFYASWCINRRRDGGLELPVKLVQARLGHATSAMTLDTYPGHLFPSDDHGDELAEAERRLLALVAT